MEKNRIQPADHLPKHVERVCCAIPRDLLVPIGSIWSYREEIGWSSIAVTSNNWRKDQKIQRNNECPVGL